MARWGISSAPIPAFVPFYQEMTAACATYPGGFPPCALAAIKYCESVDNADPALVQQGCDPVTLLMPDGSNAGRSPWQLTESWPQQWQDPWIASRYALTQFLAPSFQYMLFMDGSLSGLELVKLGCAGYNAGPGAAWAAHVAGNVDRATTNNYGSRAVAYFTALLEGRNPC
jgi:hypothetical protein